ncbi:MAG: peptidoglycan-binding protein, partial [Clostridia bacterium]|nr:peptidoglycan-binding protein [Clostridia bacterium]
GVKWLQWHLWQMGYLTESDIDGDFGPTTLKAVKQFQTDAGIDVDGVVGAGTRASIKNSI